MPTAAVGQQSSPWGGRIWDEIEIELTQPKDMFSGESPHSTHMLAQYTHHLKLTQSERDAPMMYYYNNTHRSVLAGPLRLLFICWKMLTTSQRNCSLPSCTLFCWNQQLSLTTALSFPDWNMNRIRDCPLCAGVLVQSCEWRCLSVHLGGMASLADCLVVWYHWQHLLRDKISLAALLGGYIC